MIKLISMKLLKLFTFCLLISLAMSCNQDGQTHVIIETEYGTMEAVLYNETPLHRDNFIKLAKEGFYNDLLFHRVIEGFMIQGGDPNSKDASAGQPLGSGGPGYRVDAEIGQPHYKGTLAAARTGAGNPEKKSSGSQFYIVQGRPVSEANLNNISKARNITYSPEQIAKYKQVGGTAQLDGEYTVFGEVISGLDVIDKIAAVDTDQRDRPLQDVKMQVRLK